MCEGDIRSLGVSGCVVEAYGFVVMRSKFTGAPSVQAKSGAAAKGAHRFPIGCLGPARLLLVGLMCKYHVFDGLARGCSI